MDEDLDLVRDERVGAGVALRRFPALRIREEELHDLGAPLSGRGQRVVVTNVGTDLHGSTLQAENFPLEAPPITFMSYLGRGA
ncbi:hypothetical protein GCM10027199_42990 [Amycolatopsis magusensis]